MVGPDGFQRRSLPGKHTDVYPSSLLLNLYRHSLLLQATGQIDPEMLGDMPSCALGSFGIG
jgi:hypothetical protein